MGRQCDQLGAMKALRNSGTLALVALGKNKELSLPWFELVARGIRILGSHVGMISTLKEVVDYHHQGKAKVLVETKPLADISYCFRRTCCRKKPFAKNRLGSLIKPI